MDGRLQKASKLKGNKNFKASEAALLHIDVAPRGTSAFIKPPHTKYSAPHQNVISINSAATVRK